MITRIAGEERQILDTIIRKTYGWRKKSDWISFSSFEECTGIKQRNVRRALKKLIEKQIVSVNTEHERRPKYSFNKHYNDWISVEKKTGTVNNDRGSIMSLDAVNNEHKEGSIMTTTTDTTKDIIQKIDIAVLREIFDYWNSLEIIKHKVIDKFKVNLIAALNNYTVDELKGAMENHKKIIESKDHFWTHKFGLAQFLTQKNGIDVFLTENKPFENWRNDGNGRSKIGKVQPESITKAKTRSEQEGGKYSGGHKVQF
jgi:phage replication O-like protein O